MSGGYAGEDWSFEVGCKQTVLEFDSMSRIRAGVFDRRGKSATLAVYYTPYRSVLSTILDTVSIIKFDI